MSQQIPNEERALFLEQFNRCRPVLTAVGDENRQLIIRVLIEKCGERGMRVGEIQKNTNISRTAVSHHLKVLKGAGIITLRKSGTMNFYYLDSTSSSLQLVSDFWQEAVKMMKHCPIHNKEET